MTRISTLIRVSKERSNGALLIVITIKKKTELIERIPKKGKISCAAEFLNSQASTSQDQI